MESVFKVIKNCCQEISYLIRVNETEFLSSATHHHNQSGDDVKKLDELANNILINKLTECPAVRELASEENPKIIETKFLDAPYFVSFDPLDGSSNIDVNITIGTIFTIFAYDTEDDICDGRHIVMAGYCLYGSSTQMVVANNEGVSLYSLLPKYDDFLLVNSDLRIPETGKIYSVNESNKYRWTDQRVKASIDHWIGQGYTQRWVASLVADAHRTMIKGGFFCYPGDQRNPDGKIRLLYEAYPFAFIFEKAGGEAMDGERDLLDVEFPWEDIHQKTPIYLSGSAEMKELMTIFD